MKLQMKIMKAENPQVQQEKVETLWVRLFWAWNGVNLIV